MSINSIQQYYTSIHYSLRRNGRKSKVLLIMLSFPAVIYAYYDFNERYKYYEWDYPREYLYYLCAVMLAMLIITILSINTISFVNSRRIYIIKDKFKKELFDCMRNQIPEIKGYYYYKKIHPKYFYDSGLYKSVHSDYIGDDLILGEYKGFKFEMCELHIFKLFKKVFDGLFIRISLNTSAVQLKNIDFNIISKLICDHNEAQNISFKVKNNLAIYVAVKRNGKLFEQINLREIRELEDELILLSDIVKLTTGIIDCCCNFDKQACQSSLKIN